MASAVNDAALSFEAMTAPLSEGEPCGPDLDLAGDADYMNFMASGEGVLPASFYVTDPRDPDRGAQPFDRTQIDFKTQYAGIAALSRRTRDLRLIALLAKFRILDRDLAGFVAAVEILSALLEQFWEGVHPQGEDGDFFLRMGAVQSLDDMTPVILPLTYAPLFQHKRLGPISYRAYLVASGETAPRSGEDKPDFTSIRSAFEKDIELAEVIVRRDQLSALAAALARIKTAFVENVGAAEAVAFPRLTELVEKMRALLDSYVVLRDPSAGEKAAEAAPEAEAAAGAAASGEIANFADAAAALGAAAAYFARFEPSNPALLLVRQAEQLIGKSFLDVIRVLIPGHVEEAHFQIGRAHVFDLPIEKLSDFAHIDGPEPADEGIVATFEVTSRDNALQLLAKVSAFYHRAEPSSPISFLVERARSVTGRDFLGLLKDMLPPDALKALDGGK